MIGGGAPSEARGGPGWKGTGQTFALMYLTFASTEMNPEQVSEFLTRVVQPRFATLDGVKAYLAGPPVMVETATAALTDLGVRRQDCHADAFYTEAEKAALGG